MEPVAAVAIPVVTINAAAGSRASAARFRLQWKRRNCNTLPS
jgi:hypothetical protein